ncbi:U-box domain-containing protein 62-like isoform X4 [Phragmites australis]|uniref:U-box domain-containing protein 62-like isoform X4 n=1 Tax=Phragmites australis TaxID=29695 RepID=UPI002D7693E0|nr:U-box domain-containing protein 62-like isoform X4 [Phragmites australis]
MASPPGVNCAASSSRRALLSFPFPFPIAAHFPSRAAGPFLGQHHPPATSGGEEEVEEDEGSMDDDSGSQQRRGMIKPNSCTSMIKLGSWWILRIGRAVMSGENGSSHIQEGQQWQQHSRLYDRVTEQYGRTSSGGDEPGTIPRETRVENGYGVIGGREGGPASSYWDLLRAHLSDPLTGVLMDDAMILSCGHSYGSSGMQHIYRMKACGKCGQPITKASIRPNLALRLAVQAFKREKESAKALKKRRECLEQDKCGNDDQNPTDLSRGKSVHFPFAVFDRVIIKGNKRTPERFVGRVAVVTAQCLNGWYVVKTLDDAESVKLQYRSLAKVADGNGSCSMVSNNAQNTNWL